MSPRSRRTTAGARVCQTSGCPLRCTPSLGEPVCRGLQPRGVRRALLRLEVAPVEGEGRGVEHVEPELCEVLELGSLTVGEGDEVEADVAEAEGVIRLLDGHIGVGERPSVLQDGEGGLSISMVNAREHGVLDRTQRFGCCPVSSTLCVIGMSALDRPKPSTTSPGSTMRSPVATGEAEQVGRHARPRGRRSRLRRGRHGGSR